MALPCPGPSDISLLDIQNEFGGTYLIKTDSNGNPIPNTIDAKTSIDEYYRGGSYVANNTNNVNIPTSGQISFANFFCSSGEVIFYITQDTANVDVSSLFGDNWTSIKSKRLIINPGVKVYNTNPYAISNLAGYAMRIYNTFNGNLTIQNFGSIQGAGGISGGNTILAGESRTNQSDGGQGGNAIYIGPTTYGNSGNGKTVYIDNQGTIYAGGGGGGAGTQNSTSQPSNAQFNYQNGSVTLTTVIKTKAFGGRGQGYNQSNTLPFFGANRYGFTFKNTYYQNYNLNFPPYSDVTITNNSAYTRQMFFSSNSDITLNQNSSGIGNIDLNGYICDGTTATGVERPVYGLYAKNYYGLGGVTISGTSSIFRFNESGSGLFRLYKDPNQNYYSDGVLNKTPSFPDNIYSISNQTGLQDQPASQVTISGAYGNFTAKLPAINTSQTNGGDGGDGGNYGTQGKNGKFSGGPSGYAIVNSSKYVNYINQGTIAGQTT